MIDRRQIRKSHQKDQPVQVAPDAINACMLSYLAAAARGDEKLAADLKARYDALCANFGTPAYAAA